MSQTDVTEQVVSKRELVRARENLEAEKVKTNSLLLRQRELIDCLGWVNEVGSGGDPRIQSLIGNIRKSLSKSSVLDSSSNSQSINTQSNNASPSVMSIGNVIEVHELLGAGSYGKVSLMITGSWLFDVDVSLP